MKIPQEFDTNMLKRGARYFLIATLIGLLLIFFYGRTEKSIYAFYFIDFRFLLPLFFLAILDIFLGATRIWIFARKASKPTSYMACLKANAANIFVGALTPSQTGGGLGQIYMLNRTGLSIIESMAVSSFGFISSLVILIGAAAYVGIFSTNNFLNPALMHTFKYSILLFSAVLVLIAASIVKPVFLGRLLKGIGIAVNWIFKSKYINRFNNYIIERIYELKTSLFTATKNAPLAVPFSFLLSAFIYLNKFTIAFVVILALGFDPAYFTVIEIQAILTPIYYFMPTPGGSGVAEVISAGLIKQIIPFSVVGIYTVLWRFFILYIGMGVGAFALLREIGKS